jgi:hypothetical protein
MDYPFSVPMISITSPYQVVALRLIKKPITLIAVS